MFFGLLMLPLMILVYISVLQLMTFDLEADQQTWSFITLGLEAVIQE